MPYMDCLRKCEHQSGERSWNVPLPSMDAQLNFQCTLVCFLLILIIETRPEIKNGGQAKCLDKYYIKNCLLSIRYKNC